MCEYQRCNRLKSVIVAATRAAGDREYVQGAFRSDSDSDILFASTQSQTTLRNFVTPHAEAHTDPRLHASPTTAQVNDAFSFPTVERHGRRSHTDYECTRVGSQRGPAYAPRAHPTLKTRNAPPLVAMQSSAVPSLSTSPITSAPSKHPSLTGIRRGSPIGRLKAIASSRQQHVEGANLKAHSSSDTVAVMPRRFQRLFYGPAPSPRSLLSCRGWPVLPR